MKVLLHQTSITRYSSGRNQHAASFFHFFNTIFPSSFQQNSYSCASLSSDIKADFDRKSVHHAIGMRKVVGETAPKSPTHLAYSLDFIYTHRLQKTRHHPFPEWHSQCGKSHVGHESGFRYNWMKNYGLKLTSTNAGVPWLTRDVRGAAKQKSGHAATLIFIFSSLVTRRVRVCAWVRQCVCLHVCLYCMLERVRARAHPLMRMRMIVGFEGESMTVGPISFPKKSSPPSPPLTPQTQPPPTHHQTPSLYPPHFTPHPAA